MLTTTSWFHFLLDCPAFDWRRTPVRMATGATKSLGGAFASQAQRTEWRGSAVARPRNLHKHQKERAVALQGKEGSVRFVDKRVLGGCAGSTAMRWPVCERYGERHCTP